MKKLFAVIVVVCLLLSFGGCDFLRDVADSTKDEQPKTFDFDGISIELTTQFLRMDFINEDYDFIVGNDTVCIMGFEIPTDDTDLGDLTVLEFAQYFRTLMEEDNPTEVSEMDGIPTLQYTALSDDGEEQTMAVMFYKADDCFWAVCFACATEKFDAAYADICQYAKSVTVA